MGLTFSYINHIDALATTLLASSSVGTNDIVNVADPRVGKRWRVASPGGWGQADFGSDKPIDFVALVFPRDTTLATGTVRHMFDAASGTAGSGATFDSGAVDIGLANGYGYHIYRLPSPISARWWRFEYVLTSAYADTGRAWAGPLWQPSCNINYGDSDVWDDLSTVTASRRSGAEFVDAKPRQRNFAFGFDALTPDDILTAREMQRLTGVSSQVIVVKDFAACSTCSILGRISKLNPILAAHPHLYSQSYQIRESL